MPTKSMQEKMVPVEVLRELSRGSYEHLSLRIDDAVQEHREMFVGKSEMQIARLATFKDHVIVGSGDGRYFKSRFEDVDSRIQLMVPEKLDVPVVDRSNKGEYVREYALSAVDALLSGNAEESSERLLNLIKLSESVEETDDVVGAVVEHVRADRPWRKLFREQRASIQESVKDLMESIRSNRLDKKYVPLYDGSIPEDKFESYRDQVGADLSVVADRLEQAHTKAEAIYIPFSESIANVTRTPEEDQVLSQFTGFAEDFFRDMQEIRETTVFALKNEACVMCLGQVHDALTEALTDYEIASSFISRMVTRFTEAK